MIGPRGYVVYRGPSRLTGTPIVAVVTLYSDNRKIGDMSQLWILDDGRQAPHRAVQTGRDASICGACPLRGNGPGTRACYVRLDLVDQLWRRVKDGAYPVLERARWAEVLGVRPIRLGAYGDAAALPYSVVRALARASGARWTGYTHQWRQLSPGWAGVLMASVESETDYLDAKAQGWRTFRGRPIGAPVLKAEIVCPASDEAGKRTSCAACQLCKGTASGSTRDITVQAHGAGRLLIGLPVQGGLLNG